MIYILLHIFAVVFKKIVNSFRTFESQRDPQRDQYDLLIVANDLKTKSRPAVSRRRAGDISNDRQRVRKVLTKVQTVIKLVHCTLFVLQIVHRCDSGPRTVRPAHQITMAGDKVLSGDCRFARRNYFPDTRKEIAACVTMARSLRRRYLAMETRNEFLHSTFLLPSPRYRLLFPHSFFSRRPFCRRASPPFLPRHSDSSFVPFRSKAVLVSPPLGERVLTRN